jgi:hypothetical protein
MKKIILLVFSPLLMLSACGDKKSAENLKVEDLKDACDCNTALIVIIDDAMAVESKFDSVEDLGENREAAKKIEGMIVMYEDVMYHCESKLKLESRRERFDCEKNNNELEEKMKKLEKFF